MVDHLTNSLLYRMLLHSPRLQITRFNVILKMLLHIKEGEKHGHGRSKSVYRAGGVRQMSNGCGSSASVPAVSQSAPCAPGSGTGSAAVSPQPFRSPADATTNFYALSAMEAGKEAVLGSGRSGIAMSCPSRRQLAQRDSRAADPRCGEPEIPVRSGKSAPENRRTRRTARFSPVSRSRTGEAPTRIRPAKGANRPAAPFRPRRRSCERLAGSPELLFPSLDFAPAAGQPAGQAFYFT